MRNNSQSVFGGIQYISVGIYFLACFFIVSTGTHSSSSIPALVLVLCLAETHFGITWLLLYKMKAVLFLQPLRFIYIPIAIAIGSSALFFYNQSLYMFGFMAFNIYHVNRQSTGFYIGTMGFDPRFRKYRTHLEGLLHCLAGVGVMVNVKAISPSWITSLILLSVYVSCYMLLKTGTDNLKRGLVLGSTFLIWAPLYYFDNKLLALITGVSLHYAQYLMITSHVLRRTDSTSWIIIFITVFSYSLVTTMLLSKKFGGEFDWLAIIPTTLQLLHFYYDSLIWRRGNSIVRERLETAGL